MNLLKKNQTFVTKTEKIPGEKTKTYFYLEIQEKNEDSSLKNKDISIKSEASDKKMKAMGKEYLLNKFKNTLSIAKNEFLTDYLNYRKQYFSSENVYGLSRESLYQGFYAYISFCVFTDLFQDDGTEDDNEKVSEDIKSIIYNLFSRINSVVDYKINLNPKIFPLLEGYSLLNKKNQTLVYNFFKNDLHSSTNMIQFFLCGNDFQECKKNLYRFKKCVALTFMSKFTRKLINTDIKKEEFLNIFLKLKKTFQKKTKKNKFNGGKNNEIKSKMKKKTNFIDEKKTESKKKTSEVQNIRKKAEMKVKINFVDEKKKNFVDEKKIEPKRKTIEVQNIMKKTKMKTKINYIDDLNEQPPVEVGHLKFSPYIASNQNILPPINFNNNSNNFMVSFANHPTQPIKNLNVYPSINFNNNQNKRRRITTTTVTNFSKNKNPKTNVFLNELDILEK